MLKKQRPAPHSTEAEEHLLGAVLMDGESALTTCLDAKVCADSFYVPANTHIWTCIQKMLKKGLPIEVATVAEELQKSAKLQAVGGAQYLSRLVDKVPTSARLKYFIEVLQDHYTRRQIIERAEKVAEDARNMQEGADFAVFATQIEDALRIRQGLQKAKSMAEACDTCIEKLERIQSGKASQEDKGLDWPWADATRFLKPIRKGEVLVAAGRPGRGKSSLARQMVQYWSQYGTVLYFTREMDVDEVAPLFAQTNCGLSLSDGESGKWHISEFQKFKAALNEVKLMKNVVILDQDNTEAQILARFKGYRMKEKVVAVVIDYLQLMNIHQEKGETRDQAIGRFMLSMKDAAKDSGVPFVVLAQLNRSVEREERKPRLSDLRESGNIEQTATRVVFVHWCAATKEGIAQDLEDESVKTIECQLIQAKSRYTGGATCDLIFKRPIASFLSAYHAQA